MSIALAWPANATLSLFEGRLVFCKGLWCFVFRAYRDVAIVKGGYRDVGFFCRSSGLRCALFRLVEISSKWLGQACTAKP